MEQCHSGYRKKNEWNTRLSRPIFQYNKKMNLLRFGIEKGPYSPRGLNCYLKWNDRPEMPGNFTIRRLYDL